MNGIMQAGLELKRCREELGLSLDDAYLRTRISPAYLKALEEGDLSVLPAPCYAGGFVRTYCQMLALEPERFVDCYRAATRSSNRQRGGRPKVWSVALREPRAVLPPWASRAFTWVVVCGIVALSWMAYSVVFQPTANPDETRAQASTLDEMVVPETDSPGF